MQQKMPIEITIAIVLVDRLCIAFGKGNALQVLLGLLHPKNEAQPDVLINSSRTRNSTRLHSQVRGFCGSPRFERCSPQ